MRSKVLGSNACPSIDIQHPRGRAGDTGPSLAAVGVPLDRELIAADDALAVQAEKNAVRCADRQIARNGHFA